MKRKRLQKILIILSGILLVLIIVVGFWMRKEIRKFKSNDPLVWKKEIRKFNKLDSKKEYPENAVLFVGSSSIRFWNTLHDDMVPIPVIQRGFGGSKIGDVLYWAPTIIYKHKVNKIVIFAGTNDITGSEDDPSPREIADRVKQLVINIHTHIPEAIIYYISITPTPNRRQVWSKASEANDLIKEYASSTENFKFLDFTNEFLNTKGLPDKKYFKIDGLHLNDNGYAIWTKKLKPLLIEDK